MNANSQLKYWVVSLLSSKVSQVFSTALQLQSKMYPVSVKSNVPESLIKSICPAVHALCECATFKTWPGLSSVSTCFCDLQWVQLAEGQIITSFLSDLISVSVKKICHLFFSLSLWRHYINIAQIQFSLLLAFG